ncbi:hypothetical protein Bhyg_02172 [Pseudolycoriella hygida]|uniref:Uncharacterized protein n=1 Tax=Pseudolycoriella hygida TaxID=35572 RepID=A0A9Q0S847_9DIPT|nr:hypothetical protein Bhyg_02172 [Pseudolycoriella hygida]
MYLLTQKKIATLTIVAGFCVIIWNAFSDDYGHSEITSDCNVTSEYLNNLEKLLEKVHTILDSHKLKHILCYNTLWGQIRISNFLPWTKKADLCIFKSQLDRINEGLLYGSFQRKFLRLRYFSANGYFIVKDIYSSKPFVQIYVFAKDEEQQMFKRVGWKRGLLPPNCEWTQSLECFPANLIVDPLPVQRLGANAYPVPMGGIEIQKYHYADSWWKKPKVMCT